MPNPPVRRRRPPPVDTLTPPELAAELAPVAAPAPAVAPVVPVAPVAPAPRHVPTDFGALSAISQMDRGEVTRMMDAYIGGARGPQLQRGDKVSGRITRLTGGTAFVDVGSKADAAMDRVELPSNAAVGDVVDAWVVKSAAEGELKLSRAVSGDLAGAFLDDAKATQIIIEGKVTEASEHGLKVQLTGGIRAFCPVSHIDRGQVDDTAAYVGQSMGFRVIDVRGREAIVSHRVVAEEEERQLQSRQLATLKEGDVLDGEVVRLMDFGAFVKVPPGLEGLVHISNISRNRIKHPNEALKEGQAVRVRVLSVEADKNRLNLGIKQAEDSVVTPRRGNTGTFNQFEGLLKNWKPKG